MRFNIRTGQSTVTKQAASLTLSAIDGVVNRSLTYQIPTDLQDLLEALPERFI